MATVTAPIALDSTLQSTNTALTAQNALLTSANSNSLADVMEDGIANIVSAIGAIPTPTAANVSFDDSQAGLGESNVQGAIEALNDNLTASITTDTHYVSSITVSADSHYDADITIGKTGYTPLGIVSWIINGNTDVATVYVNLVNSTTARVRVRNYESSSASISNIIVRILYMKNF